MRVAHVAIVCLIVGALALVYLAARPVAGVAQSPSPTAIAAVPTRASR